MYNRDYVWTPAKKGESYEQELAILVTQDEGERSYHQYQHGQWVFVGHYGLFGEGSNLYTALRDDNDHRCYLARRRTDVN